MYQNTHPKHLKRSFKYVGWNQRIGKTRIPWKSAIQPRSKQEKARREKTSSIRDTLKSSHSCFKTQSSMVTIEQHFCHKQNLKIWIINPWKKILRQKVSIYKILWYKQIPIKPTYDTKSSCTLISFTFWRFFITNWYGNHQKVIVNLH